MSIAALIRSMATAGATPEVIALAVEAIEIANGRADQAAAAMDAKKAEARDRKRRERERKAGLSEDGHATVTRQSQDMDATVTAAAPEEKVSPTPPSKTQPPKGGLLNTTRAREPADFDQFWAAYPRKVGRDDARKAYAKAILRIDGPDPPGRIMVGLARARPGWTDPQFIPHPATWLNRGSWDDEPPENHPQAQRPPHERPSRPTTRQAAYVDRLQDIDRAMELAFEPGPGGGRNRDDYP